MLAVEAFTRRRRSRAAHPEQSAPRPWQARRLVLERVASGTASPSDDLVGASSSSTWAATTRCSGISYRRDGRRQPQHAQEPGLRRARAPRGAEPRVLPAARRRAAAQGEPARRRRRCTLEPRAAAARDRSRELIAGRSAGVRPRRPRRSHPGAARALRAELAAHARRPAGEAQKLRELGRGDGRVRRAVRRRRPPPQPSRRPGGELTSPLTALNRSLRRPAQVSLGSARLRRGALAARPHGARRPRVPVEAKTQRCAVPGGHANLQHAGLAATPPDATASDPVRTPSAPVGPPGSPCAAEVGRHVRRRVAAHHGSRARSPTSGRIRCAGERYRARGRCPR